MAFDNLLGYILSVSICMQSFITILHSVRLFSFLQNLVLGTASTNVKCHFVTSWARFGNPSVEIMSIVMSIQNFIKIYQKVQEIGPVSRFSEFEPRQNPDQSQMSFDNLIGYILSISTCMQNFITILFTVQEIGPFSLFQNLELGKASTDKNVSSQSLGLDLVNINIYAKVYHNIPLSSRDRAIFTFSEFGAQQSLDRWINVILQLLELDLVNITVSAKFYQNIPNGLRVKFHLFQNLNLCKTSTNPKCHLTISWATPCQYQYVCKISSQYFTQFKR